MTSSARARLERDVSHVLDFLAIHDQPEPADIIWGLGSNEPRVAEKAAALYREGLAPWIVFSGGRGHRWADLPAAEAEMFARTAIDLGVPADRIVVEHRSTNTGENVTMTVPILAERGIEARTALLITIPPFQTRAHHTVRTHCKSLRCINQPVDWGPVAKLNEAELVRLAELCIGEVARLHDYPRLGYIDFDPATIPPEVIRAAEAAERALGGAAGPQTGRQVRT